MNCSGLHCPGCGHGSRSWLSVGALVLVLIVIVAKGRAIEHVAAEVARVLVLVVITALSVAVAGGVTAAAIWYHRRTVRAPATRAQLPVVVRKLGPAERPAIEMARPVWPHAPWTRALDTHVGESHTSAEATAIRQLVECERCPRELVYCPWCGHKLTVAPVAVPVAEVIR